MGRALLLCLGLILSGSVGASLPADGGSIWPRITAGMQLGQQQRPEVQRWIRHYAAQPKALEVMLERSSPYLWFIVESAELRELPMELALLPAVESGFDAHARSRSAALGLWQFIPVTGKAYGLSESAGYDARRDPVASTRAALRHLAELHGEFGDWLLALAAYNGGGVRVRAALRQSGSRDFWALNLRAETRDYVPRLLALAAIVREPARYGLRLPMIGSEHDTELVILDARQPLAEALHAAQIDQALLRRYNPGLKALTARTHAPGLLLPPTEALVMRAELAQASVGAAMPVAWREPAASRPRLRLSDSLPDPLGLRRESGTRAPPRSPPPPRPEQSPSVADPATSEATSAVAGTRLHRVARGETQYAIARRYGIPVEALRAANSLGASQGLEVGQSLRIPER